MNIQDNVLKHYLQKVYFFLGTPCGGKSTTARALGKRLGLPVYGADERFSRHLKASDPRFQPVMNKRFQNADEFFGRSVAEYEGWLRQNAREQLDYILLDLIRLSQEGPILCDGNLTMEEAIRLTEPSRCVFLIRDPHNLAEEYAMRPDHRDFCEYLNSATDPEAAKRTVNETLLALNEREYHAVKESSFFWLERSPDRGVEETAALVAAHFGLTE